MAEVRELSIGNNVYDIESKSVVDQNTGKLKFWSGTKAEYDAQKLPAGTYYAWTNNGNKYPTAYTRSETSTAQNPMEAFVFINGVLTKFANQAITSPGPGTEIGIGFNDDFQDIINILGEYPMDYLRDTSKDFTSQGGVDNNTIFNITDTGEIYKGSVLISNKTDTSAFATKTELKDSIETKITNCITEIPQDIKLELNNGTLTLKAGSKVYYNGSPIIIDSDRSYTAPTSFPSVPFIISVVPNRSSLEQATIANSGSFASNPGNGYVMWFNTTDKNCYINDGNANATMCSYPICTVNCTNGAGFTSIDQVFNGFGYIGSTVFALPGVKGLIPNGRNEDGSLKNTEFTTQNVVLETRQDYGTNIRIIKLGANYISGMAKTNYRYDEINNFNYEVNNLRNYAILGELVTTNNKIDSFTMPTTFHSLDYNDQQAIRNMVIKEVSVAPVTYEPGVLYVIPE